MSTHHSTRQEGILDNHFSYVADTPLKHHSKIHLMSAFSTFSCRISVFCSWKKSIVSWPSCSKLTLSLVNDLLKFPSCDMQIC